LHLLDHLDLIAFAELLLVEEFRMVEQWVFDVRVAGITPVRKVCKRERNGMPVVWVFVLVIQHVALDISATLHGLALWLEAQPILTTMATV